MGGQDMGEQDLYLMSPTEIVTGYVFGQSEDPPSARDPESAATLTPRATLERIILNGLLHSPCGVAFSGGRDSSVVLAVATSVARREGLAEPVAITRRFPEVPSSSEREWQEDVVRHLGLKDWHRVEIHDELDIVGPLAQGHLLAHGVVWPPTIAGDLPLLDAVRGGTLIDGEGGDQVLGVEAHLAGPLVYLLKRPRPLRLSRIEAALSAFQPAQQRAKTRMSAFPRSWLRPAGHTLLLDALTRVERERPLAVSTSIRKIARRRGERLGTANRQNLAQAHGVSLFSPLLDLGFVESLARDGGRMGRGNRTDVLRRLVPDLLPDRVLARTSKAHFTTAYLGRHTREFAAGWDGQGVDCEYVDAQALRDVWLSDSPMPPTSALLQSVWLANNCRDPDNTERAWDC